MISMPLGEISILAPATPVRLDRPIHVSREETPWWVGPKISFAVRRAGRLRHRESTWRTCKMRALPRARCGTGGCRRTSCIRNARPSEKEAPSCTFVPPLEQCGQPELERLYKEAKEKYFSGSAIVSDSFYDKLEDLLRRRGSELVRKYPRCSLNKSRYTYSDAEYDQDGLDGLAAVWGAMALGGVAMALQVVARVGMVLARLVGGLGIEAGAEAGLWQGFAVGTEDAVAFGGKESALTPMHTMGLLAALPILSVSGKSLLQLAKGNVVALKGQCPGCSEEVYAYVSPTAEQTQIHHRCSCHNCGRKLAFELKVVQEKHGKSPWSEMLKGEKKKCYGRIYLLTDARDLEPEVQ